jgi:drug/metabolite transporter (DMT)-like permease
MRIASLRRDDLIRLILAATCWGLGTVASKRAVEDLAPFAVLTVQLAAGLGALVVLMRWRGLPIRNQGGAPVLGRLGILNPGVAYALSLIGLASISASLSVLIWAFEPLLILALAALALRERVGPAFIALSLVAIAGMILVLFEPATDGQWPGILLTFAGVGCCAIYTVVARRWIGTSDSTAQVVVAQQAHALAFAVLVLGALAIFGGGFAFTATPFALASAIGSGVLYYAAAYWFYLSALRRVPASLAAVSFYLIPVVGVVASFVVLGERLDMVQWVGVFVVMAAVSTIAIVTRDGAREVRAVPLEVPS